jgi:hypothetical protein
LARTLQRVRRLQLNDIRLIPNTALLLFFLAALCDVRRIMHAQAWSPKRLVVSRTRRDHLTAMLRGQVLRGQALSVGLAV